MSWQQSIDPYKLRPIGGHLVVKRDPPPDKKNGMHVPQMSAGRAKCRKCHGAGVTAVIPVYEEDGIKISKHVEVRCERCDGAGYRQAIYDPREKLRNFEATVISVGPGEQKKKVRFSDNKTLWYKNGRRPMEIEAGDRVLVARWAGWSGMSYFIDDDFMVINDFEVLAVLEKPQEGQTGSSSPEPGS